MLNTVASARIYSSAGKNVQTLATARMVQSDEAPQCAEQNTCGSRAFPTEALSPDARSGLLRLAFRLLSNRDDAEDAVQDAMAAAQPRIHEIRDPVKWWSWLQSIVVQRCRLAGRKHGARRRAETRRIELAAHRGNTESDAQTHEANEFVRRLLMTLPNRQREVIVLRFMEEKSYEEIGVILEVTPATCRVHAHAALEAMRQLAVESSQQRHEKRRK